MTSLKNGYVSGGFAGITTTNSYNNRLQPSVLSAAHAGVPVVSISYGFDQDASPSVVKNNGNVVQIANNRENNRTQSFTYDELNRVATAQSQATSGTHCWGNSFAYDIWANLLSKTVTKCTAETLSVGVNTSNRITNTGFTYDAAGNLTNSGAGVMTYDAENRLATVAGVTYTYDGDGKRVKKSNGKLYWTGTGALAETDLAGVIESEFTFFNGKRVARRDGSGNTVFYYFSDHLGSASVVTNATGTIVEESDYYPFGGERVITNSDPNQYKFTGKERDTETGLDYFGARHYSSNLGRFATPDGFWKDSHPGAPQSWNEYAYVRNNPLRYIDPTGEASTSCHADGNGCVYSDNSGYAGGTEDGGRDPQKYEAQAKKRRSAAAAQKQKQKPKKELVVVAQNRPTVRLGTWAGRDATYYVVEVLVVDNKAKRTSGGAETNYDITLSEKSDNAPPGAILADPPQTQKRQFEDEQSVRAGRPYDVTRRWSIDKNPARVFDSVSGTLYDYEVLHLSFEARPQLRIEYKNNE